MANKTTVVRVYPGITGATAPILAVPATLVIRRAGTQRTLTAAAITVDPAHTVTTDGGLLDVSATLERKRAALANTWNFVLPVSATDPGTIDELEVRLNPPELSGPHECLGCNDAANRLTVLNIPFEQTASLSIGTFYLRGDSQIMDSHRKTFCGGFLNMYPLRDGCGTSSAKTNEFPFGINLLFLKPFTKTKPDGSVDLDREYWQRRMGRIMQQDKGSFVTPAAYMGLGPDGMGGPPGDGIFPATAAVTDYPGLFEEFRYGIAAHEVGHGDFLGSPPWHVCGDKALPSFPVYTDASGESYYRGSIGHVGIDTTTPTSLAAKDPKPVSDFMGYTYCDRSAAHKLSDLLLLIRADTEIRIGATLPIPAIRNLLAKGIDGDVGVLGLTFRLQDVTPGTSLRVGEATIRVSGLSTGGTFYVQVDGQPPAEIHIAGSPVPIGQIIEDIARQMREQLEQYFGRFPWVSPFTFRRAFPYFRNALASRETSMAWRGSTSGVAETEAHLLTSGQVGPGDTVALDPFYLMMRPSEPSAEPGAGPYSLVFEDSTGQTLLVWRFDLNPAHPDVPDVRRFYQTVPFPAETSRIVFKQDDIVLATRTVSANPPQVALLSPHGGESWGANEGHTITWTASDADGDTVYVLAQYSRDGGDTWETIDFDLTDAQVEVDTQFLPGSGTALVRVLATDGVNTAADQSAATFAVASKEPSIWITGFDEQAVVQPGTVLNLQANYFDPDGEGIADTDFVWRSDRLGVLGTGASLEVPAVQLPPGSQEIMLTVPGEQGPPVTERVTILRAPALNELLQPCVGDCNRDAAVTVDEIIMAVNIGLDNATLARCAATDANEDSQITVDEILTAVNNLLTGCPAA